jgi:hypothetical protein
MTACRSHAVKRERIRAATNEGKLAERDKTVLQSNSEDERAVKLRSDGAVSAR